MQPQKEILCFYSMVVLAAGVLFAADRPVKKETPTKKNGKCCVLPPTISSPMPLNTLKEGILRFKA